MEDAVSRLEFEKANWKGHALDWDNIMDTKNRALEYNKNQCIFEDELVADSSIDDVDSDAITRYKAILNTDAPDEQVLRSRRFMRDGHLTIAGLLLFGGSGCLCEESYHDERACTDYRQKHQVGLCNPQIP